MGFLMDGIDAEGYDRSYSDRELLGRIFDYFRPHLGAMGFVALMIVLDGTVGGRVFEVNDAYYLPIAGFSGVATGGPHVWIYRVRRGGGLERK